jgi:hypothetical protein
VNIRNTAFRQAVVVHVGLGFSRVIEDAGEALQFLMEMPPRPGLDHHAALAACRDCLAGTRDGDDARRAFARHVRARGLLAMPPAPAPVEATSQRP